MRKLNVNIIYNQSGDKVLMCLRAKEPYKGLYNLIGGKVDEGEDYFAAAYREVEEESGITKDDITLTHIMNFTYPISSIELQVYYGKLNKEVELVEEKNKLLWVDLTEDFFDMNKYAGEGNIGHMIEQVKIYFEK